MRILRRAALAAAFILSLVLVAVAQDTTAVVVPTDKTVLVPYGDWTDLFLAWAARPDGIVWTILGLVLTWLVARLPKPLQIAFRTFRVEQLLNRAVAYGINAARGAAKGQTLSVDVGSTVVAEASNYAIKHGSEGLITWAGGAEGLAEKVVARIPLEANATAQEVIAVARDKPVLRQHVKPLFPQH